ncbi:hypothetical protein DC366_12535 [Pelagivirga sediminicola]|uniref:Uncharacterized protein n=1 Tax=Pelagivirga sediminicola TaxID=2170575 RepID=A0A2T7G688_9RHOB|nr:hypothetical protein DC366_12535 [Pelagivirga sediminicola]
MQPSDPDRGAGGLGKPPAIAPCRRIEVDLDRAGAGVRRRLQLQRKADALGIEGASEQRPRDGAVDPVRADHDLAGQGGSIRQQGARRVAVNPPDPLAREACSAGGLRQTEQMRVHIPAHRQV